MSRVTAIYPDDRVTLREVGLRDGLQLVKRFPSTAAKTDWVKREVAAWVQYFELSDVRQITSSVVVTSPT